MINGQAVLQSPTDRDPPLAMVRDVIRLGTRVFLNLTLSMTTRGRLLVVRTSALDRDRPSPRPQAPPPSMAVVRRSDACLMPRLCRSPTTLLWPSDWQTR